MTAMATTDIEAALPDNGYSDASFRSWLKARQSKKRARDVERGYSINRKYVGLAFLAEGLVIITSLIGAYLFAVQYGTGSKHDFWMMMLAPASHAVIEM